MNNPMRQKLEKFFIILLVVILTTIIWSSILFRPTMTSFPPESFNHIEAPHIE